MISSSSEFLTNTPVGALHKGDTVWFTRTAWRKGERVTVVEQVVVTSSSGLTSGIIYGRNAKGRARCVGIDKITRIEPGRRRVTDR